MLHHLTGSLSRPRLPQEQFAPREPASNPLSRMINHSSTLVATLFAPPNQGGLRPLSHPLRRIYDIRCRYKLDRVLLFKYGFHFGQLPGLETDKLGTIATDTDRVSGREGQKHATLRLQNPPRRATPSPGTVALAFLIATQPQISRHAHLRSHLRRLRMRFVSISTSPAGIFAQTPRRQPNSTQARVLSLVCLQPTPRF